MSFHDPLAPAHMDPAPSVKRPRSLIPPNESSDIYLPEKSLKRTMTQSASSSTETIPSQENSPRILKEPLIHALPQAPLPPVDDPIPDDDANDSDYNHSGSDTASGTTEILPELIELANKYGSVVNGRYIPAHGLVERDLLCKWFEEHVNFPFPTKQVKEGLTQLCNLTFRQVSHYFNNKRARFRNKCEKKILMQNLQTQMPFMGNQPHFMYGFNPAQLQNGMAMPMPMFQNAVTPQAMVNPMIAYQPHMMPMQNHAAMQTIPMMPHQSTQQPPIKLPATPPHPPALPPGVDESTLSTPNDSPYPVYHPHQVPPSLMQPLLRRVPNVQVQQVAPMPYQPTQHMQQLPPQSFPHPHVPMNAQNYQHLPNFQAGIDPVHLVQRLQQMAQYEAPKSPPK